MELGLVIEDDGPWTGLLMLKTAWQMKSFIFDGFGLRVCGGQGWLS